MSGRPGGDERSGGLSSIGAVAARTGVSERTLRYYQELGLLSPAEHRPGETRRYCDEDVERILRIRELQALMGFNLEEIKAVVAAEDRIKTIKARYRSTTEAAEQKQMLVEAAEILEPLREQLLARLSRMQTFLGGVEKSLQLYRDRIQELDDTSAPSS